MPRLFAYEPVLLFFFKFGTAAFRRRVLELIPWNFAQHARKIADTIERCSKEILETKKRALQEGDEALRQQVGEGHDIISKLRQYFCKFPCVQSLIKIHISVQANMSAASEEDKLPESEVLGQMS